mmetsp:Transcript_15305/g.25261  ORF Transcript_15305/g.25261 Transcript_15305/m.25261 type:complete len:442 (+) Transcript_15305:153-1478(+)
MSGLSDFVCDHCTSESASVFCPTCSSESHLRNFCAACCAVLHRHPSFRDHGFISLATILCENDEVEVACLRCNQCAKNYCQSCSDILHLRAGFRDHDCKPLGLHRQHSPITTEPRQDEDGGGGMGRGTTEKSWRKSRTSPAADIQNAAHDGKPKRVKVLLFIGPSGVGKSTTINNIVGNEVCETNAFETQQDDVFEFEYHSETPQGSITLRIIDTPGIDGKEDACKVERYVRGSEVHCIFYVERFDSHRVNKKCMQIITETLGESVWDHTFCVLTHGATPARESSLFPSASLSAPPQPAPPAPASRLDRIQSNLVPAPAPSPASVSDSETDKKTQPLFHYDIDTPEYIKYREHKIRSVQNSIGRITRNTRRRVPVAVIENDLERNNTLFNAFMPRVASFLERQDQTYSKGLDATFWIWTLGAGFLVVAGTLSSWRLSHISR